MNTSKKLAIGLGVASGALLAAWLLTGDRKAKTKEFFAGKRKDDSEKKDKEVKFEDAESYYI